MTAVRVALRRVRLRYADGLVMHTALSGPVPSLDELRLTVTDSGAPVALGSTRVNIAYLTGIDPETLVRDCRAVAADLDWADPAGALAAAYRTGLPAPARMLFAIAAADGASRAAGQPLCVFLGGPVTACVPSNQSLFRAEPDVVLARAAQYVRRGFKDLKLRVGFGDFADDLALLRRLQALGPDVLLLVDASGSWQEAAAADRLAALAAVGLRYVEQPSPIGPRPPGWLPPAPFQSCWTRACATWPRWTAWPGRVPSRSRISSWPSSAASTA